MGRIDGKVALITGAASGIGAATAARFATEGAAVARVDLRGDYACDVRDESAVEKTVAAVVRDLGRIDIVVNAAGVAGGGAVHMLPGEEWDRIVSINVDGTVEMCRAALEPLKRAGEKGSVVNLSSVTGTRPFAQVTAYCMSKAAIDMYTRCLALELAPSRVRVNAIAPGVVVTNLHTVTGAVKDYPAFLARGRETHPLGFVGEPDDAAWMALYLCSDLARWVTGGVFALDGGRACLSAR